MRAVCQATTAQWENTTNCWSVVTHIGYRVLIIPNQHNKNYELADKIRNELSENGILIEDKDDKTTWKYK